MKIKGHGIVWDAVNNCILCRFTKGELETEDKELIAKLKKLGYEAEETDGESNDISVLSFQDLKKLCKDKGLVYDIKAKKEDLINLLKGAE